MKSSERRIDESARELVYRISPTESPSEAVIEATGEATGARVDTSTDDLEKRVLDPLYDTIDTDALDELFQPTGRGGDRRAGRISFTYEGCDVEVHSTGLVKVHRQREDGGPSETVE
jgi:hypothetical protein